MKFIPDQPYPLSQLLLDYRCLFYEIFRNEVVQVVWKFKNPPWFKPYTSGVVLNSEKLYLQINYQEVQNNYHKKTAEQGQPQYTILINNKFRCKTKRAFLMPTNILLMFLNTSINLTTGSLHGPELCQHIRGCLSILQLLF